MSKNSHGDVNIYITSEDFISFYSENAFVECVVVEVYPGGRSLALEYSPKDQTTNMTVCIMTSSSAFTFKEFDKDKSYIIPYETRSRC